MTKSAGASHHPLSGEQIIEYQPQNHHAELVREYAEALPAGTPCDLFLRSVESLGDKLNDFDLHYLYEMAVRFHNVEVANADISANGIKEMTEFGVRPNPMLKVARDELAAATKIAEKYALPFTDRLRAGIMQLAGETMMRQLHSDMAGAIVSRILELDPTDVIVMQALPGGWKRGRKDDLLELAAARNVDLPERCTRKAIIDAIEATR